MFHRHTLPVAAVGALSIALFKIAFATFSQGSGFSGFARHLQHEWVILANLFLLLTGFALLARHFEKSHVPVILPAYLPNDWKGGFVLLLAVFLLSGFLDNIAAAMIGGALAHQLFRAKVHVAYLAAIVTAANAGGAGSVIGDTTTTMMWLSGVSPLAVLEAYIPAFVTLLIVAYPATKLQQVYSPIIKDARLNTDVDWTRVGIVSLMLAAGVLANLAVNLWEPHLADLIPCIGLAVWLAILISVPARRPDWEMLPETAKGAAFLLCLVLSASMMPVEQLPPATWPSTLIVGFVSSVFDNIPLTALAIRQGGYDWGFLAYAVGVGGSMVWFGSSAGVAIANQYPEARSVWSWIRNSWFVPLAYLAGFLTLLAVRGWHPNP